MKNWKIGIIKDTSTPMLGLHALHTAFRGLPNVEVVAHVDSNPENLQEKMGYTEAKRHYLTYQEMLDKEALDIVVLTSRHPYDHLEQIKAVAEKGCHIYCEKPVSANLIEADKMVEISEKNRIKFGMAHPARYDLAFMTMKKMMLSGEIGTPLTVYGRGKNDHRGGGEDMIVLGTHIFDIMTFFFGSPEYVFAEIFQDGKPIIKSSKTETVEPIGPAAGDDIFACFRFPGTTDIPAVRGIFESKRGLCDSNSKTHMGISVIGTKGILSVRYDAQDRPLRISRSFGPPEDESHFEIIPLTEDRIIPGAAPLEYSLNGQKDVPKAKMFLESNRFAVCDLMCSIEKDRQPISNIYDARLALEMIYGIYASSLSKGIVNFPFSVREHPLGE